MKIITAAILLGIAAAAASTPALAGSHGRKDRHASHVSHAGMQTIANRALAGQAGYGWQYFADRRESRAVVISPAGDYFYSEGNGLELVHAGPAAARAG